MRLPQLKFQSIVAPYAPPPLEEFGATVDVLNQNYDLAVDNLSKFEQAQASITASPLKGDQEFLAGVNQKFKKDFDAIKQSGDFENQVTKTKQLASGYTAAIQPIVQNQAKYNKLVDGILNDSNIKDKGRAIDYIKGSTGNSIYTDPDTGLSASTLDESNYSFLHTPDVDIFSILDKGITGAKANLTTLDPTLANLKVKDPTSGVEKSVATMVRQGKISELPKDKIAAIINGIMASSPEIEAFLNKEKTLSEFEGSDSYDQRLEIIKDALETKHQFKRTDLDYSIPSSLNKTDSGTGNPFTVGNRPSVYTPTTSMASNSTPKSVAMNYKSLKEKVEAGEQLTTAEQLDMSILSPYDEKTTKIVSEVEDNNPLLTFSATGSPVFSQKLISASEQELNKELGEALDGKLRKSYALQQKEFSPVKVKGTDSTGAEIIQNRIQSNPSAYTFVMQDGTDFNEWYNSLTNAERERVEEFSDSNGTIVSVSPEMNIQGVTTSNVPGTNTQGFGANFGGKYSFMGKDLIIVPQENTGIIEEAESYMSYDNSSRDKQIIFRNNLKKNNLGGAVTELESQFDVLRKYNPSMIEEPKILTMVGGLPSLQIVGKGDGYEITLLSPSGENTGQSTYVKDLETAKTKYYYALNKSLQ